MAWAAIATASRVKARKVQIVSASCMVARSSSPSRAAAYVITRSEARSIRVRMIRGTPARPARLIPGRCGRSEACSLPGRVDHHPDQGQGRADLRDQRAERRAGDAHPREAQTGDAVDQDEVEHDVGGVAEHRDDERCAGVLEPAQDAGGGQHQQQRHGAEQGDVQVGDGEVRDGLGPARTRPPAARSSGSATTVTSSPISGRQPESVDALRQRAAGVPGADLAGHRGGGAVGQEDAQADERAEDRRGDAEGGQLAGAEVAHDGGVGEQEERLGDQGEEGRHGQPQDLPVVLPRGGSRTSPTAPPPISRG